MKIYLHSYQTQVTIIIMQNMKIQDTLGLRSIEIAIHAIVVVLATTIIAICR